MSSRLHLAPRHRDILLDLLQAHLPGVEAWAYGSRVCGRSHDGSDLDLVLRSSDLQEVPASSLGDFWQAVHDSTIPFVVEARDWARLPRRFRRRIEEEHVPLGRDSGGRLVPIGCIAEIVGGGTPNTRKSEYYGGDVPWLTPKDLARVHDRRVARGQRNLSRAGLAACSARLVPRDSVLLSTRAPVGYVALAANPVATNQGFRSLIAHDGVVPEYLYYWLRSHTEELTRHASGTTFGELSARALGRISVRLPSLGVQKRVVDVLGALDDKIEANRRMSETLDEMARAIFEEWFVKFGPTRAKIEGRQPYLPGDLWSLFPERLVETDSGQTPENWAVARVGDAFRLTMGQSPPGRSYNTKREGLPFLQGRSDFGARYGEPRRYCSAPMRAAAPGDTLVSVRAPIGAMNIARTHCCIGRGVAALQHASGSAAYTYYALKRIRGILESFESTGTVFGAITKEQFESLRVLEPPSAAVKAFDIQIRPVFERIRRQHEEANALASLRDQLVPKLLSGELRAPGSTSGQPR